MSPAAITETMVDVGGLPSFVRRSEGEGTPIVFFHGSPTSSDDWLPFFRRAARPVIAADMPGFGRSPAADPAWFDSSMQAYTDWAAALLDALAPGGYRLVVHDWGAVGLLAALRAPERVERLVALNPVPPGCHYRWHWVARLFWRRRGLGEAFNAVAGVRPLAEATLRLARPGFKAMPASFLRTFWGNWERPEMRRSMLALYRSADPERLHHAGAGLGELGAPALLLWAAGDPYIGWRYGERLAARLPSAELVRVEAAGHWSWFDRPDVIDRTIAFVEGEAR